MTLVKWTVCPICKSDLQIEMRFGHRVQFCPSKEHEFWVCLTEWCQASVYNLKLEDKIHKIPYVGKNSVFSFKEIDGVIMRLLEDGTFVMAKDYLRIAND